jgi:histidyl-tRNA synthetase
MKPSLPQGTRDFSAATLRKRNFIFDTIRSVFELYGFEPLETPSIENTETLMGKYGDEGDKLIFKILNNGLDNPEKKDTSLKEFDLVLTGKTSKGITERALRYDLTIPFARYVSMNHGQLTFPFKRYQMQPVWRADRPQKGRYREFYQCDADVAGSTSLLHETELALIYSTVFQKLRVAVEIKINNRKILSALANLCGGAERMMQITIAIDKLDKIGIEKVKEELLSNGLNNEQVLTVEKFISIKGNNDEKIESLQNMFGADLTGQEGISELKHVLQSVNHTSNDCNLIIDLSLARGLNYYTGTIFEVKALDVQMGSIGGGGRYDELTSLFDLKGIAGVGISFGVDRIYDVMEELKIFPEDIQKGTRVLFFNTGQEELKHIISIAQQLRNQGLASEIFHEAAKFDKQFKYAEKKSIPYVAIIGSREIEQGTCMLKNLSTGEQEEVKQSELPSRLKN